MGVPANLKVHLLAGLTTLCNVWGVTRLDGVFLGFTDHDQPLSFDSKTFRAESGMSALALQRSTGLSVDNTESLGALHDTSITAEDIKAGRYDRAEVVAWRVNWADVSQRVVMFRGHIGGMRSAGGAFQAEIRGLSDALNQPIGRVYQKPCSAVLGDTSCRFNVVTPGYFFKGRAENIENQRILSFRMSQSFEPNWFLSGRLEITSGAAKGLSGVIKRDYVKGPYRVIELAEPVPVVVAIDDHICLVAGCDKRFSSCRLKFDNMINFQGFPDLLSEDYGMQHPSKAGRLNGGSRR